MPHDNKTLPNFIAKSIPIVILVLIVVVSTLSIQTQESKIGSHVKVKQAGSNFPDPGLIPNPGPSVECPKPNFNVQLLIDRSNSVTSLDRTYYRFFIKDILDKLSHRARSVNGTMTLILHAFATVSIWQNSLDWQGLFDGSRDIADPAVLQKHKDLVDSIWFSNDLDSGGFSNQGTLDTKYRGYFGGRGGALPWGGATNWHDALVQSSSSIRFWTGGDNSVNASPNQDNDVVILITDGMPTVNNGRDHISFTPDDALGVNYFDENNTSSARYSVNRLRSGDAYKNASGNVPPSNGLFNLGSRAPTNVYGIMIGGDAHDAGRMTSVFGAQNDAWYRIDSFKNAPNNPIIDDVIKDVVCNVPKADIYPKVEIVSVKEPKAVTEEEHGIIEVKIKNLSYVEGGVPGVNAALHNIKLTVNGVQYPGTPAPHDFKLGQGETSGIYTYKFNVPLGAQSPLAKVIRVEASPVIDPSVAQLGPNANATAVHQITVAPGVVRIPLPS